ncbi:ubinuclein-2-like isoform X2 [Synchiropus splendidus]|uniref:ubinuclein-2-like isoform X2 n=1 Tax=Synchiropus splendidus TaxID=270530 RepID=UPI00237DC082|nr:ubinuclein-2-like isoform X2 [Synchiropus splendidus]
MAEPRKVQFVTLSAFAAGAATESRKRRLDDEADFNFVRAAEVEAATGAGAAASNGRLGKSSGEREQAGAERRATVRLNLLLSEPDDRFSAEFNYGELLQNSQTKTKPPTPTSTNNPHDPFNDDERERLQVEALAKKFENKYGNVEKKRKDRMQDLIDIGFGYDETDPFIDNSEAYDELVPASLTTKLGGFYINTGTLQFRTASDSEGEEKTSDDGEQLINRRKKKEASSPEEKNQKNNRVSKQGVTAFDIQRPEKKKRKKLMKDSLYLAAMLRRFTQEKEELRKINPKTPSSGLAGGAAPTPTDSREKLLTSNSAHAHSHTGGDLSLADLTSDPSVMSLLGSANEKELQDLLGELDFNLLDADHELVSGRENGTLGFGVRGGVQGRGSSSGLYSPPPLPGGLPAPLIKRIEDLRAASRQFDQEGRKKFFTLDMNNILLDIELQVQEQPPEVRSDIYLHMEAFVPCNKEALLKRLKKLSLNIQAPSSLPLTSSNVPVSQDDRLRTPLLKMKLAVCSVMPEQIARYNMDCMAKVAKQQSEEGDKNGSEEDDEEKPGKRVVGPRKKFLWDDKLRSLLCSLVRVKLSCYEMENKCALSVEDYLKAFLENEVKLLWPKGWMQTRILFKESVAVHGHITGNLVKRRTLPAQKARAKEALWIHNPPLGVTSKSSSQPTSSSGPSSLRPPLASSSSEPICLSDSLDEDLAAPSLDSISHALALLSSVSKGMGPSDSPLSPPPLQIPTSSPPPVAPHYPAASHLSTLVTTQQHSQSRVTAAGVPTTQATSSSTSSSSSPAVSRTVDSLMKGSVGQSQRLVAMATPNPRCGSVVSKTPPSPSPPKPRPPTTASPLLSAHQKAFGIPSGMVGGLVSPPGLSKSTSKSSSNGSHVASSSSPSSQPRAPSSSLSGLQSFCPPSPVSSSSPQSLTPHVAQPPQSKAHSHHAHANFITPMQATLTKSSLSSNSSPIIKLTPRPPAPTPPPVSSPSPSSSPSHSLPHPLMVNQQPQHQFSPKTFRAPFSMAGAAKLPQSSGGGFSAAPKAQSPSGASVINKAAASAVCSAPDKATLSSVSPAQVPRPRTVGGVGQSSKTGNGWTAPGSLASSSTTPHLSQVSPAGSPLLSCPSSLPLGFGMLGGLVPVSLPFQFPPLLNFNSPAGASGMGPAPNSGYPLAQSDLMDLYKSLQSGSQAALPPHLQLAYSDANQSQSGDMKRKSH